MLGELGQFTLVLALILSIVQFVIPLVGLQKNKHRNVALCSQCNVRAIFNCCSVVCDLNLWFLSKRLFNFLRG